jgi:hypothetical protein
MSHLGLDRDIFFLVDDRCRGETIILSVILYYCDICSLHERHVRHSCTDIDCVQIFTRDVVNYMVNTEL